MNFIRSFWRGNQVAVRVSYDTVVPLGWVGSQQNGPMENSDLQSQPKTFSRQKSTYANIYSIMKQNACVCAFDLETERRIRANDPDYNNIFAYKNNLIRTAKYTIFTFLPKNLFEQFRRIANAYFLFLLILQVIPQTSSLSPWIVAIPLMVVLGFTMLKDLVDDVRRHRSDNEVNNRKSLVVRDGQLAEAKWQTVVVGDIIKMQNNQFVAADLLLLSSSEPNSLCFIETAELDGETNLKVRQSLFETAEMKDNIELLAAFNGEILCERPNNKLSKFEGALQWNEQSYSLDNDKILLRGCVLRNTEWCFGLVVFAGMDSKLMMNSGKTPFKRTNLDSLMNSLILGIFVLLFCLCFICALGSGLWEANLGFYFQRYLPWPAAYVPQNNRNSGAAITASLQFLSYIIILNTVVPISLYISVEVIRLGQSGLITCDAKMYYEKNDTPASCRTTTLTEELGQVEYIFSDKTGTLTQNIMTFNRCSINGIVFGDVFDERGEVVDVTEKTPKIDFSHNPYYEPAFDFYDKRLLDSVTNADSNVHRYFKLLAMCHTVMPSEKDGKLEYQAQSPDEAALVGAARNFGFVFKSRTPNSITIEVLGVEETYEVLSILDFNSDRKRMSVILRKDGIITLFCKGADSTIFERLASSGTDLRETTTLHLESFAQEGLRTLCCAVKDINHTTFEKWRKKQHAASIALVDREAQLDAVYEEIETGMTLIGATAVEDRLQEGVPEAIANLARAGIKMWVLTGDKQETAINIGYSCKLLTEDMAQVYVIDSESQEGVATQLRDAQNDILSRIQPLESGNGFCNSGFSDTFSGTLPNQTKTDHKNNGLETFGIVINGHSLVHVLKSAKEIQMEIQANNMSVEERSNTKARQREMEKLLLDVAVHCKSVICCRVTPLQKALVVRLVKHHKKTITLAIGDGANDVSMIKTAHIGVGISGLEGTQAVLASDYSLAQFAYLERLLLVHGRWSYLRTCKFLKYFFYKNFSFTLCHFWFAFFNGFSAQTLYDPYFILLYNLIYTSTPVLVMGIFDQDVNDEYSLRYPNLYAPGHLNLLFNKKVFLQSLFEGIVTSFVVFFVTYGVFQEAIQSTGVESAGLQAFGTVVAASLIVIVTLRCGLETSNWTYVNHITIWGSIICYFAITLIMYASAFHTPYEGVAVNIMSTANFWFTILLCVVLVLLPIIVERFYYSDTRPTLTDKVLRKQRADSKPKLRGKQSRIIRRASSLRQSQRSVGRTGYAFSHQQGFGELITSGSMMNPTPIASETPA